MCLLTTNMKIRAVRSEDIETIVQLCGEHAVFEQAVFDPTNKTALLHKHLVGNDSTLKCFVAEIYGEVVGYASFTKQFSTWEAAYYVYLDCLYLKEKTRGHGVGCRMMDEVKAYARSENCRMVQWQTPDFNLSAIRFYQRLGAVAKTKQRFFWEV